MNKKSRQKLDKMVNNFLKKNKKRKLTAKRRPIMKKTAEEWRAEYQTDEWSLRRKQILMRDRFKCTKCPSTTNLQVHHKAYDPSLHVWQYTNEYLVTLCQGCHHKLHDKIEISSLYTRKQLPIYKGNDPKMEVIIKKQIETALKGVFCNQIAVTPMLRVFTYK